MENNSHWAPPALAGLLFLYSAAIIKRPQLQMYTVRESLINSGQVGVTVTLRHQFKIIKSLNESPVVIELQRHGSLEWQER